MDQLDALAHRFVLRPFNLVAAGIFMSLVGIAFADDGAAPGNLGGIAASLTGAALLVSAAVLARPRAAWQPRSRPTDAPTSSAQPERAETSEPMA